MRLSEPLRSHKALSSGELEKARGELDRGFASKLELATLESEGHLSLPANSFSGIPVDMKTPRQLLVEAFNETGGGSVASEPALGLVARLNVGLTRYAELVLLMLKPTSAMLMACGCSLRLAVGLPTLQMWSLQFSE